MTHLTHTSHYYFYYGSSTESNICGKRGYFSALPHTLFFFCQMWLLLNSVDNVMPLTENCLCLFPSFSCLKVLLLQRTRSSCFLIVYTTLWTSFEKLKRAIYKTLFNSNPYLSSSPPSFKSQKTQIRKGELRRMTFRAQNELQFWQPRVDMQFQSISPLLC